MAGEKIEEIQPPHQYSRDQLRRAIEYLEKDNVFAARDAIKRAVDDLPSLSQNLMDAFLRPPVS